MPDCPVTCIRKPHRESQHEHITHLGNTAAGWMWTREAVIASIDAKTNTFYVVDPVSKRRADVYVRRVAGHLPFLQTYADGDWRNNLLSLDTCPVGLA
ncbi:MAG: hypothetical protein JWO13_3775 [Acidobacteriales bacterium]|nr:hypothetical protein [Terriglobales bacterium]